MAMYDNKVWLLRNIRDAFIATDDTGLCEIIMGGEDFSKIFQNKAMEDKKRMREERLSPGGSSKTKDLNTGSVSDDDRDIASRFDPYPDIEDSEEDDITLPGSSYIPYYDGGHRHRSNTAQWLDKKEQAMKKAAKIKVIKWDDTSTNLIKDDLDDSFSKKEVLLLDNKKSLLVEQLDKCPDLPHRQYLEYAKFDGTAQIGMPIKSFKIFMTMLPEQHQNYPIVVCVIASSKIKDLIGFTCYKYSIDHPEVTLASVQDYGLCIAEDDGEVDWAFPCLDANEPCSKFGFTCLGLVDLKNKMSINQATSSISDGCGLSGAFQMLFPKPDSGQSNQNNSRHNTGGSATSEAVINALQVVINDKKSIAEAALDKMATHIQATEAPHYKAYKVQLLRKMRANIPVQLGISRERIEVEPLAPNKHLFWSRTKYFLHSIDTIAWCQILEAKTTRTTFRMVYTTNSGTAVEEYTAAGGGSFLHPTTNYKQHDFDCDHDVAKEIVEKINTILEMRNSPCRRDYKIAKEKKVHSRRSFHLKHMS